jgi:hypothetical protein
LTLVTRPTDPVIARGPGPRWLRLGLVVPALIYYSALLCHHPPQTRWLRPPSFFTQATCLFPRSDAFAIEYRLEVWSCSKQWQEIDFRPYFPIQPDDKESRFQRLGYFYDRNRAAMQALDSYISSRHAEGVDDGVAGPIGGIRLVKIVRPFPAPGQSVERYHFDPREPIAPGERRDMYYTPESQRRKRCTGS